MSCYFRQIQDLLLEAGISITKDNRKQIDKAIHEIVEVTYPNCPATWKKIKNDILNDKDLRRDFINKLQKATLS